MYEHYKLLIDSKFNRKIIAFVKKSMIKENKNNPNFESDQKRSSKKIIYILIGKIWKKFVISYLKKLKW